ncbi:hypothetical protein ILUMI_19862 [Ignelater luminosus]|uniref:Uncharacterized protein n=1 Tax=Ignelater luminosus TaxID=2038154 RepID=A0A8K0CIG9_IGNLU|nr:hypothetical protein ILUMI_19862 [Ignelater luminosus]
MISQDVSIQKYPVAAPFNYLDNGQIEQTFPKLSMERLKGGIFDGPQIRTLMKDANSMKVMTTVEAEAWSGLVSVKVLQSFRILEANRSIKIHFLHNHLGRFPDKLGDCRKEQGELFQQDIKVMEERYQARWNRHMMVVYCWSLQRPRIPQKKGL